MTDFPNFMRGPEPDWGDPLDATGKLLITFIIGGYFVCLTIALFLLAAIS